MRPLLAKSWNTVDAPFPNEVLLAGHLQEVLCAGERILQLTMNRQLDAFGLASEIWKMRLRKAVRLAAAIHDIGKANSLFQDLLHGSKKIPPIRHEWLSVWIAQQSLVKQWLLPAIDQDENLWHVVMFAIAGHHPKMKCTLPQPSCLNSEKVTLCTSHPDFTECLRSIGMWLELSSPLPIVEPVFYSGSGDRQGGKTIRALTHGLDLYQFAPRSARREWQALAALAKANLIAADVAGSALWDKLDSSEERVEWIEQTLGRNPARNDFAAIVNDRLAGSAPRLFQERVASSDPRTNITLLEAGCGTGKTLAAYLWAQEQIEGRRLWFCYPTTGTSSEGFRSYLCDSIDGTSRPGTDLFHSRAKLDKQLATATFLLADKEDNADSDATDEVRVRVDSLIAWDTMIVSCTVDQVLGLLQNHRSGLYAWPALAQSAFVFDEIHCYDDQLFGNLLTFLEKLRGLPVLLMTASLPEGRRVALRDACLRSGRTLDIHTGPEDHENLPRYIRAEPEPTLAVDEAEDAVRDAIEEGGRVLWISNTVARCRDVAGRLQECQPIVYHSRFIYRDRQLRHKEVVDLFDSTGTGFASTSQVAELSLDLRYMTLLISELAPISALIQRLGRLNRHAHPNQTEEDRPVRRFIIIDPVGQNGISSLPYEDAELEEARQWLDRLGNQKISQRDLIREWKKMDHSAPPSPEDSSWLIGKASAGVKSIRKSSYGITVVMQEHFEAAKKEGVTGYLLPMDAPRGRTWAANWSCSKYPVAREGTIAYDAETGGEWKSFLLI